MKRSGRRASLLALWGALAGLGFGCSDQSPPIEGPPGEPLPGLTAQELQRFQQGQALFLREFTPDEGLGPLFNDNSCFSCHDTPTSGGTGVDPVTLASRWIQEEERCELPGLEGNALVQQRMTPALAEALQGREITRSAIPPWATAVVEMIGPPLYGLGLVNAIPDEAILARTDPGELPGGGIAGRAATTPDGRPGRFGRKATHADLRSFTTGALLGEMGITTPAHPNEIPLHDRSLPDGVDPVAEPELTDREVDLLTDYVRFLAAPPRTLPDDPDERARVERGEGLFTQVGCAGCHVPEMTTGPSEVGALDRVSVPLYSDLLLHDLGPEMASICGPDAGPSEWRTAILMGLRFRTELLHDGRAMRLQQAIGLHGGEAAAARAAFQALAFPDQQALLAFLRTL